MTEHTRAVFRVDGEVDVAAVLRRLALSPASELYHRFEPIGESWCWMGPTGHAVLHTWPEHNIVTVDVYGLEVEAAAVGAALGWEAV